MKKGLRSIYEVEDTIMVDFNGPVTGEDEIEHKTALEYRFKSNEQKLHVCYLLQKQLGSSYEVNVPSDEAMCIVIDYKG